MIKQENEAPVVVEELPEEKLRYKKTKEFFHCAYCINQLKNSKLKGSLSPKDYGMYEAGSYEFVYPDGISADIVVLWCKRCKRQVWDSRHLKPREDLTNGK